MSSAFQRSAHLVSSPSSAGFSGTTTARCSVLVVSRVCCWISVMSRMVRGPSAASKTSYGSPPALTSLPFVPYQLQFLDDPAAFLEQAGAHLAADPVQNTVLTTFAERSVRERAEGIEVPADHPRWWLVVRDAAGAVVGAGMRTAPFPPHPAYVVAMPEEAARELARALHARGEDLGGVNGALPAAQVTAEEIARLTGRGARVHEHTRLFELGDLVEPTLPPGQLLRATPDDLELAVEWYLAFGREAAEQAGRGPDEPHGVFEDEA